MKTITNQVGEYLSRKSKLIFNEGFVKENIYIFTVFKNLLLIITKKDEPIIIISQTSQYKRIRETIVMKYKTYIII